MCTPKSAGGLNLINLQQWNKTAIAKTCWDLKHKQDKLWIRWIHAYYIKGQQFHEAATPQQACWMVRKVLEARAITEHIQHRPNLGKSLIKIVYLQLIGSQSRPPWKCLMFNNSARPKAIFTMWLQLQDRLLTTDRLQNWGIDVNIDCIFCQNQMETRDHLFKDCDYSTAIWRKLLLWSRNQNFTSTTWEEHAGQIVRKGKGKSVGAQIFRLIYAEFVYAVWLERNQRIFEKKSKNWESVAREIAFMCSVRASPKIAPVLQQFIFT
ncbi:uncharacterized protein LOC132619641 [Lycium barbarum]|uniref:uncharacterized protein LOC132619641 n=1 Tax=Lycium barbarum TaxID=112863 RepID=UPI00293E3238|nr:uncharacterized protein LOC132619641 [Lycium barbarum]